jgi:hypothetical protein
VALLFIFFLQRQRVFLVQLPPKKDESMRSPRASLLLLLFPRPLAENKTKRKRKKDNKAYAASSPLSTDSDLEAFSRNRSHVSFAALPFQATANTNDAIKWFLSY